MRNINVYCPLVLSSRHFLSRSKSEIGNILLYNFTCDCTRHSLQSVLSNRKLDTGAGRGDDTLVVLTYIHPRTQRLNYSWIHSLLCSRDPEIQFRPLSLKEHPFASILLTAASPKASHRADWCTIGAICFRNHYDQCSFSSLYQITRSSPQSGVAPRRRTRTMMLDSSKSSTLVRTPIGGDRRAEVVLVESFSEIVEDAVMRLAKGQGSERTNGQGVATGLQHMSLCVVPS